MLRRLISPAVLAVLCPVIASAANSQWVGSSGSEWDAAQNWSRGEVPSSGLSRDTAILASGDVVAVSSNVAMTPQSVDIIMRTNAVLTVSADFANIGNFNFGQQGGGVNLLHDSGTLVSTGNFEIGKGTHSRSNYLMESGAILENSQKITVYSQGILSLEEGAFVLAEDLEVKSSGTIQFNVGESNTGLIDVDGALTIAPDAKLILDFSNYRGGGGLFNIIDYNSITSELLDTNFLTVGMEAGANVFQAESNGSVNQVSVDYIPESRPFENLWFSLSPNTGNGAEDVALNSGRYIETVNAPGIERISYNDGNGIIYETRWSGNDYNGDDVRDVVTVRFRVDAYNGSGFAYSSVPGQSEVTTLGGVATVSTSGNKWGVVGGQRNEEVNIGQTLKFTYLDATVDTPGLEVDFLGFREATLSRFSGKEHKHIIGVGSGLNSGVFTNTNAGNNRFSLDGASEVYFTGAGSLPNNNGAFWGWSVGKIGLELKVKDLSQSNFAQNISDYSDIPAGPSYLDPYPAETDSNNYPEFSWDTVPRWLAVRNTREIPDDQVDDIADNYQIVMLEKSNAQGAAYQYLGTARIAKRLKDRSPNIFNTFYRNTVIHYPGNTFDSLFEEELDDWARSRTVGGERIYLDRNGRDITTKADGSLSERYTYNAENAGLRDWWVNAAVSIFGNAHNDKNGNTIIGADVIDAIFLDRISEGDQPLVDENGNPASGYVQMIQELRDRVNSQYGDKLIVGNTLRSENNNGDREMMRLMEGSYLERWTFENKNSTPKQNRGESVINTIRLMREALSLGKIIMLQSGPISFIETGDNLADSSSSADEYASKVDFALGVFLIVAEEYAYFSYQDSVNAGKSAGVDTPRWMWDSSNIPVLQRPLGQPLGDPQQVGYVYVRSFENADVWINVDTRESNVLWKTSIGVSGSQGSGQAETNKNYDLTGKGKVLGTSDRFHFMSKPLLSDGEIVLRVDSISAGSGKGLGGVMFRKDLSANAPFVGIVVNQSGDTSMNYRTSASDRVLVRGTKTVGGSNPKWIKLVRSGDSYTAYVSVDKSSWTYVYNTSADLGLTPDVGIFTVPQGPGDSQAMVGDLEIR